MASIFGVFMKWAVAEQALEGLGAQPIGYDRMLDYWLRMAAGDFTLIGCWYHALAIWPIKFRAAIPWFGIFMLLEGVILFAHGLRLGLPPFPFYADSSACLLLGGTIIGLSKHANLDAHPDVKAPAAAA
jgi:hypothetical protein